jgi:hypothetical protein
MADGRTLTAIDVQRHFLEQAERHQHAEFMPAFWTEQLCREWRQALDQLEAHHGVTARRLDWAIKLDLFRQHAARRRFAWETLPIWNEALRRLHQASVPVHRVIPGKETNPTQVVPGTGVPHTPAAQEVLAAPPGPGLDWNQLPALLQLRQELFEIDWRFGELGQSGLFAQLERAGVLSHHFEGVDNIEHAMAYPPDSGRALLRGDVIRRVMHVRDRFACDWKGIFDIANCVMLDLGDPFASEERWRPFGRHSRISGPDADPATARLFAELF